MIDPKKQEIIRKRLPLPPRNSKILRLLPTKSDSGSVALACSGGADSVFLLNWVLAHFSDAKDRMVVLHYNHGTRGQSSDDDQTYVSELCSSLEVDFVTEKRSAEQKQTSEAALRADRFEFFHRVMRQRKIKTLLLGHHLQDKIETFLMRLSRGSSLNGLVSPKAVQPMKNDIVHLRPLIHTSKDKIVRCLEEIGHDWKEDLSNEDNKYYRNFVRNNLLPYWADHCPQKLSENIALSCSLLEEDAIALNNWASSVVESFDIHESRYPLSRQQSIPGAIRKRSLFMWLNHHKIGENLSNEMIHKLISAKPGESFNLHHDRSIHTTVSGDLELISMETPTSFEGKEFLLSEGSHLFFPDQFLLTFSCNVASPELTAAICAGGDDPHREVHLDTGDTNSSTKLRIKFWEAGMHYQPLGMKKSKKLQDCFVDRKIPQRDRKRLPVVHNHQGEILWIPGLPPANQARVSSDSKTVLRLTYNRS